MARKVFVQVNADFDKDGRVFPRSIVWEDGRSFCVDRILDVRPAPSLKAGGSGMRYTCRIGRKDTYLYYEDPKWFVDA